jgi:hypothetical protein
MVVNISSQLVRFLTKFLRFSGPQKVIKKSIFFLLFYDPAIIFIIFIGSLYPPVVIVTNKDWVQGGQLVSLRKFR